MKTVVLAAALSLFPVVSQAQQATDPKWNAWLGCWELVFENARESATTPSPSRRTLPNTSPRPQVCVEPAANGVTLTTRVADQTPIQQTVIADGAERPISDKECRGTQRADWSGDGRKLYSQADLQCSNDKGNRRVSGISILGTNGTWTDIQAVDVSGQQTVRVRNYRRVAEASRSSAGLAHATPLTLADVKEASTKVSARALEAALVETGSSFDVTGKDLLALQNAKVPGSVTDLIIALSYPDRFVVERRARADTAPASPIGDDPFFLGWAFGYPLWWDYGFYSPLYGPYAGYFYSPFYAYLPWYDPRYYYGGGGFVIIGDGGGSGGGGGGGGQVQPSGRGRAVDGLGYTRVRPREAEPTPVASAPGSVASSSGGGSSSSSGGGGGGSVSSQGFSSGGSGGGDGGRTAQPR